jgi:hypothetical protein
MQKKWAYILGVLFLVIIRLIVLETDYDEWLFDLGYDATGNFIYNLKSSDLFNKFFGGYVIFVFVFSVIMYWGMHVDDTSIGLQFLLLPIAYVPFSIVGKVLETAQFEVRMLWIHPLIILPFGYVYVAFWKTLIWLFEKLRLVQ